MIVSVFFMKKTKIVATIGLASCSKNVLKELSNAGVDIYRLNFSHGDYEWHEKVIDTIRDLKLSGGILLDTKGPEIRVGEIKNFIEVKPNDKIIFTTDKGVYEDIGRISVNYEKFKDDVKVGTIIIIDSGLIKVKVTKIVNNDVYCDVIAGSGKITTKRHINLMGEHVSLPTITEKDWNDIDFGIRKKVDFIALSFVRSAKDVEDVREFCRKKEHIPSIISKIENKEAVDNLTEIVCASDGIMVARGDMACEIGFAMVPQVQKDIMKLCHQYSKPVIVATQMLMSMVDNISPTRAEVSDVANAVFEGTSAVMTSDETTKGIDPVNVISVMADIVKVNENINQSKCCHKIFENLDLYQGLIKSIIKTINCISGIDAIVVISKSIKLASYISNERPFCPIYAFTDNDLYINNMSLLYGVYPTKIVFDKDCSTNINNAFDIIKYNDKSCKKVLLCYCDDSITKESPIICIQDL